MPSLMPHCDVLIVGLGPVGATLTALLGRAGLTVQVLEPLHEIYPLPRAAHVDHEVMRIFQSLGIVDRLQPHLRPAPDYEFRSAAGEALMRVERAGVTGASGWSVGYNIHQPGIEREIRRLIEGMPDVAVAYGARFEALLRNDAQGVQVQVGGAGQGTTLAARFVVGCDGAWSPVRESLGVTLEDYAFDEPWLVLDALAGDERGFPGCNLQLCDPDRPTTFVHMGPGRLRWEFMLKPGEEPQAMQRPEALDRLLAPWRRFGELQVERSAVYRFHGLVARQWRVGNVFLAGDAAHQMPPFLGQGMCSGLRDAANLAWKIERMVKRGASEALADSYQQERDPHVRFIIEKAIEMGRVVCTLDPDVARRRDAEMLAAPRIGPPVPFPPLAHGWLLEGAAGAGEIFPQPAASTVALDDHLGRCAWLIVADGPAPLPAGHPLIRGVSAAADLPEPLASQVIGWLRGHHCPAVLVRPDRYVFGTGEPQALVDAYLNHNKGDIA